MRHKPKPHYEPIALQIANVSGVEGFDFEIRFGNDNLFSVSCDEANGAALIHFSSESWRYSVGFDTFRRTLDEPEARLLKARAEWKAAGWSEGA